VKITPNQKAYLGSIFERQPNPSKQEYSEMAQALSLPQKKIEKWFWDQRSKTKRK
jgi:hypothetical protein